MCERKYHVEYPQIVIVALFRKSSKSELRHASLAYHKLAMGSDVDSLRMTSVEGPSDQTRSE